MIIKVGSHDPFNIPNSPPGMVKSVSRSVHFCTYKYRHAGLTIVSPYFNLPSEHWR